MSRVKRVRINDIYWDQVEKYEVLGHVICYESRKLKEHEKNYATHDLELVSIVHALKMWRHYLMGRRFELRTDHYGLKYLFDQPNLNARQARWLEFLCEFDF